METGRGRKQKQQGVLGQQFNDMKTGTGFRSNNGVLGQEFSDMEIEGTGFRSNKGVLGQELSDRIQK